MAEHLLFFQIQSVVHPYLGEKTQKVLNAVCARMVGVDYTSISLERLGSLIYWLRILLRSEKMVEEEQLERLMRELEQLRGSPIVTTNRGRQS